MRPFIIGIGGAYSGIGKTTLASLILKRLKGWGAIKYTKTTLYCSMTNDITTLSVEGKDTKRFMDSGAEKVLWVQSPYRNLAEMLNLAIDNISYMDGILIEGNSAIKIVDPDIVIFLYGDNKGKIKKGIEEILGMADVVIYEKEPPLGIPENATIFQRDDMQSCVDYLIKRIKEERRLEE